MQGRNRGSGFYLWVLICLWAAVLPGCNGSGGLTANGGIGGTGIISGGVPGTVVEAFGDHGEYFRVTSELANSAWHPFRMQLPAGVGFHLVMVTNQGTPEEVVAPIGFREANGTLRSRLVLSAGATVDLGNVPLPMARAEIPAGADLNHDGVMTSPFILDDHTESKNPLRQVDPKLNEKVETDAVDEDQDGVPNVYDKKFKAASDGKDSDSDGVADEADDNPANLPVGQGGTASGYALLAWNDLGMHCLDGNDYSLFSILPPGNNLHAQLIDKSGNRLVSSGVSLTFKAVPGLDGKMNTGSAGKSNFWSYVAALFAKTVAPDTGLSGVKVQGLTPQALVYNPTYRWWAAEGIPVLPYNDDGSKNYYQLVEVAASDAGSGKLLATTTAVLPVSDEMDCRLCHASNSNGAARPAAGWVTESDGTREYKGNILRLHDERRGTALSAQTPVLCASCHLSNALPGSGRSGVPSLTAAMHRAHAGVAVPGSSLTLDSSGNRTACYACHPGALTKCLRGAMGNADIQCQDCHGDMSAVGAATRAGWLAEPNCQSCHQDGKRYRTVFAAPGKVRTAADSRFATNANLPQVGADLYRFSAGHGGVQCEGCHGATHAIYPSREKADNLQSIALQGYAGTVGECAVCHATVPLTSSGGPHGMHTLGQAWVKSHGEVAEKNVSLCTACHGLNYMGSPLSVTPVVRNFNAVVLAAGQQVGCYDCHNGPGGK